jgi:hypothetical protein
VARREAAGEMQVAQEPIPEIPVELKAVIAEQDAVAAAAT